jgi:excinuclease ABC subunit C
MKLLPTSPALHFIQQIRDEAHRFAITRHRKKMAKSRQRSKLEHITGIGKGKRIRLLKHFGGMTELESVGVNEIAKVPGIGESLAKRIYEHLHA